MSAPVIVNPQQSFAVQIRATSETTQRLFGLTWEETARQAHRHTVAVQSWLSSRAPGRAVFMGTGITATSTGIREGLLNLAHSAYFSPEMSSETVENEIEAVRAFFHQRGVPFMWWLSPQATPTDMGARLLKHGMVLLDYRLPTLVAPLTTFTEGPEYGSEIQVWQAQSQADLQAASTIRHTAFQFPNGVALAYFEDMAEDWLRGDPARLFVARVGHEGPPVAIGALIMGADLPGVYVMATLPEWEGQGLGKAILTRILQTARDEGHEKIVLTAGARAYSLYRKFGFEHIYEYELYGLP
ncbi:MAG: GNAT family N-acetyltransferase [Anaerolineales bacterium]|nr:GNAT family N-acetyltransferase [Anaerolineales bacterium]